MREHGEDGKASLFRLVMYQNVHGHCVEDLIIPTLRRAYRLTSSWTISGLGDFDLGNLRHVIGVCAEPPVRSYAPALASLFFELQPGRVIGRSEEGGWIVLQSGDFVRFDGDIETLLFNLPQDEARKIRSVMQSQLFRVSGLMADGSVEIELSFDDRVHFFRVHASDIHRI